MSTKRGLQIAVMLFERVRRAPDRKLSPVISIEYNRVERYSLRFPFQSSFVTIIFFLSLFILLLFLRGGIYYSWCQKKNKKKNSDGGLVSNIIEKQSGQPFGVPLRFTLSSNCRLVKTMVIDIQARVELHASMSFHLLNDDESYTAYNCVDYTIRQFVGLLLFHNVAPVHKDEIRKTGFSSYIIVMCW